MMRIPRKTVLFVCFLLLLTGSVCVHAELPGQEAPGNASQNGYSFEPELSGDTLTPNESKRTSPITVEKKEDQSQLKLETGHVKPYLGAGKEEQPSKEIMPLISKEDLESYNRTYNLETGVGVSVKDNIDFNLGYRVKNQWSLMEGPVEEQDSGQIRFGIHFNY